MVTTSDQPPDSVTWRGIGLGVEPDSLGQKSFVCSYGTTPMDQPDSDGQSTRMFPLAASDHQPFLCLNSA